MLANIMSFKGFESTLALAPSTSAIFFPRTVFEDMIHFRNCFRWILPMLKSAQNSFFIAFTKCTSNVQLTLGMVFDTGSTVEKGSMIGKKFWEERKKKKIAMEGKRTLGEKGKRISGTKQKGSNLLEVIKTACVPNVIYFRGEGFSSQINGNLVGSRNTISALSHEPYGPDLILCYTKAISYGSVTYNKK